MGPHQALVAPADWPGHMLLPFLDKTIPPTELARFAFGLLNVQVRNSSARLIYLILCLTVMLHIPGAGVKRDDSPG